MLSVAKEPLKLDIFNAFKTAKVAKAFETAILTTFPADSRDLPETKEIAETFGEVAAGYLAGALAAPLTEAIDKYVKQIGILATPMKLMSPTGPVTGVIEPTEVQIL